jgi:general secretion pathway protein J
VKPVTLPKRTPDAGVTLIEMMIALALFALIGSAGFATLDQVLRSQRGTEGRLERLSERQRALHVILTDFKMAEPHSLQTSDADVSLDRTSGDGSLRLRYHLIEGVLRRAITDTDGTALADQAILTSVEGIAWRFLTPEGVWSDVWPNDPVQTLGTARNPRAVELVITLQDQAGSLRRVAPLPADLE